MFQRILIILCFSLSLNTCFAGHEEGGLIINYRSLASLNGDSLEYEITVYSVFSLFGVSAPTAMNVSLSSSCFANSNYSIPRVSSSTGGLLPLIGADYCAPTLNISTNSGLGLYRDTVILPGKCADFRFFISSGFGRYNFTTNISNGFSTNYFFVTLDNMNGPNSTPIVDQNDILSAVCLLKPLTLFGFIDPDGDSLVFTPSTPQYISGTSISNFAYQTGYTRQNPVNSPTSYVMDSATGQVNTTLNTVGAYAIGVKFVEYRLDTALGFKVEIAKGRYIMNIIAASSCAAAPFNLEMLSASNSDSLYCGDSTLLFRSTRTIEQNTLTSAGSEFVILSQKNNSLAVVSATSIGDSLILLQLNQPVSTSDTITLMVDDGTDTNTIFSSCGNELVSFADTLVFYSEVVSPIAPIFTYTSNALTLSLNASSTMTLADSIVWDFGDGSSLVINQGTPSHTYSAAGNYTITLSAYNHCGTLETYLQNIEVCDSMLALFNFSINGNTVDLDAAPTPAGVLFKWDFGDNVTFATGSLATTHSYTGSGTYTICLTAFNLCGDSATICKVVELCQTPNASWIYNIVSTTQQGMEVAFDGSNSANANRFRWDFGDGGFDTISITPTHIYVTPSLTYLVTLQVYNACLDTSIHSYRLDQIGLIENRIVPVYNMFPNPTQKELEISWSSFVNSSYLNIYILDMTGKLISEIKVSEGDLSQGSTNLDVHNLKKGLYSVVLRSEEYVATEKLIIN